MAGAIHRLQEKQRTMPQTLPRLPLCALVLAAFLSACAAAAPTPSQPDAAPTPPAPAPAPAIPDAELERLRAVFADTVRKNTLDRLKRMEKYGKRTKQAAQNRAARLTGLDREYVAAAFEDAVERMRRSGFPFAESRCFVYVDANPSVQLLLVGLYDAEAGAPALVGADLISTGKLRKGEDSFITPTGVFEHVPANFGYRAQGTPNKKGWRGLGKKGSRVWDFGFQQGLREFRRGVYPSQMRLLMHATDPKYGEPRLGSPDSKGCVRISGALNRFLDGYGVLDRRYEALAASDPGMWLLKKDRTPVSQPGSFLIIGDSRRFPPRPNTADATP